jgi:hypothetical protein
VTHQRGTGYQPDPPDHRYNLFAARHPAARKQFTARLPDSVSLLPFAPPVAEQDGTSSCVGQAMAVAIHTLLGSKGAPPPAPVSGLWCYNVGRMVDRAEIDGDLPPLRDDGAQPNQCARGLTEYGLELAGDRLGDKFPGDPDYPYWLAHAINAEPVLGAFESADRRRVLADWTSVGDGDPFKVTSLVTALAAGFPFVCAVDSSVPEFQEYDGTGVLDFDGQCPDHMVAFLGYRGLDSGLPDFLMQGSWGKSWGDKGRAWVKSCAILRATFSVLVPRLL